MPSAATYQNNELVVVYGCAARAESRNLSVLKYVLFAHRKTFLTVANLPKNNNCLLFILELQVKIFRAL